MSEQAMPAIAEDGTHVFPISSLEAPDGGSYDGASGKIRWSPSDGLTFIFRIPRSSGLAGGSTVEGATPWKHRAGFNEVPREPAWTGTVAGGKSFRLFATKGASRQELRTGTDGTSNATVLIGQAVYGELVLANDGPVSFFRATPRKPRYFISGFQPYPWPDFYEERFDEGKSFRAVGCITLQAAPLLCVVLGGECGVPDGAWLVDEGDAPQDIRTPAESCDEARRFVSFLVGRSVPFLWTDRFTEADHLTRLYYGSPHGFSTVLGNEQPLPLCHLIDVVKYSQDICTKLPAMFEKFRTVAKDYDIDFISSPIWSAFDTYADDKLTFACVSLERLATAHEEFLKRNPSLAPTTEEFLTTEQGGAIKPVLGAVVRALADPLKLSGEAVRILIDKKINNIHTPPNADKLKDVFTFLGLELSSDEKKAIDFRNRTLHGRRTMKDVSLAAVAKETRRFDVLRTLINKAMLRLLDYDGPYMDCGAPEPPKSFSIKVLEKRPVAEGPTPGKERS